MIEEKLSDKDTCNPKICKWCKYSNNGIRDPARSITLCDGCRYNEEFEHMEIKVSGEDMSEMKTTENDTGKNLQSIISMYQHDRRRFFQQKLQLESYIQKELGLSDDWIVELLYNQLKITTYKDYSIYEQNRICKCFEKYVKNISVVTDYISKSVQIIMELKRMEDDAERNQVGEKSDE